MISILFPTIGESMLTWLPQVDLTFSLGDFAGAVALVVTGVTFYISHTHASQSEQIKTSRELWERIRTLGDMANQEKEESKRNVTIFRCFFEMNYFAYLILREEIKDQVVLDYYSEQIEEYIVSLIRRYTASIWESKKSDEEKRMYDEEAKFSIFRSFPHIGKLIEKWKVSISGKMQKGGNCMKKEKTNIFGVWRRDYGRGESIKLISLTPPFFTSHSFSDSLTSGNTVYSRSQSLIYRRKAFSFM